MTFLELQTEVFRRLEESSSSPVFWTLAQVKEAINDGYEEISDFTEWSETSQSLDLTASVSYFDLSAGLTSTVLSVSRILNTVSSSWLVPTTDKELDGHYARWEDATGDPQRYLIRGLWWLGVFPKAASLTTSTVFYSRIPTALVVDGDTPGFPQEFHLALVYYALYDLLCQDGEPKKALKFWGRYKELEERLRRYVKGRTSYDRVEGF